MAVTFLIFSFQSIAESPAASALGFATVTSQSGGCTGFHTQTQGGWGTDAKGKNPGTYRDANFAGAFPNGVTIGCSGGNTLILTSSAAVDAFLPSGSTPSVLPAGALKDPGGSYNNVLAAQLVTAVLNVGFDAYDPDFSSNSIHTGDLFITTGIFAGKTVNQLIAEANAVIGGCASTHTPSELNDALTSFNENYDNGTTDNGFTSCTPVCNLSVSGTKTDITCNGADNGAINITATGNNGILTYLWNDGATTEDRTDLSIGSYSVQVSDAAGCKATSEIFTISQPSAINISGTTVDVTTINGSNGSIDVTVTGGTGPYTYKWNDGATTEDRTGLVKGTYAVTVTDAHGCSEGKAFSVNEPSCNISVSGKAKSITCNGSNNGSIDITVSNSTGNVSYVWNDGAITEDRTDLSEGNYSVQVTDAVDCKATSETFTIIEPTAIDLSGISTDVNQVNGSDGTIDITVTGGTGSYTYKWSDGATTEDRNGLSKGNYSVIVTDANGCTATEAFVINQPGCNITLTGKVKRVTCFGGNDGGIDLTVNGATGNVTYLWNDGVTTEDRTNLSAGKYSVTVTDSKGCSIVSRTVPVRQPKKIKVSATITGQKTKYVCDGTAQLVATGGTAPYKFIWADGYVGASRTGLCMASYTVTVQDKKGCTCQFKFRVPCEDTTINKGKQNASAMAVSLNTNVSVAPNPTSDVVRVAINAPGAGNATITVFDFAGKALLQQKISLSMGSNQHIINLGSFAKGVYNIQVVTGNSSNVFKIVLN
jgi:hypothetical protein